MKLATLLECIRGNHRYATADDIRKVFGDYHNALRWLAFFLTGDHRLADSCLVDACTIAQTQTPVFHEWLVHWAARPPFDARSGASTLVSRSLLPSTRKVNQFP